MHIWGGFSSLYILNKVDSKAFQLFTSPRQISKLALFVYTVLLVFSLLQILLQFLLMRASCLCASAISLVTQYFISHFVAILLIGHWQLKGRPLYCLPLSYGTFYLLMFLLTRTTCLFKCKLSTSSNTFIFIQSQALMRTSIHDWSL